MEGSPIDIPTLSLNAVLLLAIAFPAGFSAALASVGSIETRGASTPFLALLTLPFVVVALAVWMIDTSWFRILPATAGWILLAVLAAPVLIGLEIAVQRLILTGSLRGMTQDWAVDGFWRARPPLTAYLFVTAIAVGEEFLYRHLAFGLLLEFGASTALVVALISILYGLNHLYFGPVAVVTKTFVGVGFAGLYLVSGSLLVPIIAHAAQSTLILSLSARRNG